MGFKDFGAHSIQVVRSEGILGLGLAAVNQLAINLGLDRISKKLLQTRFWLADSNNTVSIDGYSVRFETKSFTQFNKFLNHGETPIIEDLLHELENDDCFYDIGANVGFYSCFANCKINNGNVIAFEPHPSNAGSLERNLEMNGHTAQVHEIALIDEPGEVMMSEAGDEIGEGSHKVDPSRTVGRVVPANSIDNMVLNEEIPKPTVVKIDVEGAEMEVLKGAMDSFGRKSCRVIYCEVHPDQLTSFGSTPQKIESTIEELGFKISKIKQSPDGRYMIKGSR